MTTTTEAAGAVAAGAAAGAQPAGSADEAAAAPRPTRPPLPPVADPAEPLALEAARELVAAGALRAGPVGAVGLELERHVVDVAAPQRRVPWDRLRGALRGVRTPSGSAVTLEPGGQVELSSPPAAHVAGAVAALREDAAVLDAALAGEGLVLLSVGADPSRPPERVNPGARYAAMEAYFRRAGHGADGALMMCSTASLQVNVEAGPAAGWAERLASLARLRAVLVALGACSPYVAGGPTGLRSSRAAMWCRLDPGRCAGPASGGLAAGSADPAQAWAGFALEAPVMLVRGAGDAVAPALEAATMAEWVTGARPLAGRRPTADDLELHLSTLWPPVRLRGFLELRLLDAVPADLWPGLAALVVAALDDPAAADGAAHAAEPVADLVGEAARDGLSDRRLRRAAAGVVAAALPAVPDALRPDVERWAALVDAGRTPADLVTERARRDGHAACLLAEELR
ncbi:ergothioneine biosynthesis glutamate--cysteine ligase EgtA [uncultured Pseudokineococcus sp.]|uniref:ergothioneine biosynthesis glutamate--cysteine ligase EgtA n=1 Tax=uncultured Pseudokineococcus sp. TaxID=1642928 RepID=UPI00263603A5|nr:ergothioneine biosynthesis glutamate--cysteine ligase EgtA [uncultured Pseudokineococcus sp.]